MFKHEGYSNGAFSTKSEKSFYTNTRFVKFSEKTYIVKKLKQIKKPSKEGFLCLNDRYVEVFICASVETNSLLLGKLNDTVSESKESEIRALPDTISWPKFVSFLADDDISSNSRLITEDFHTKSLGITITTIGGRSLSFFVSHSR